MLVLGEDREAVQTVCELAAAIPGARGIYASRFRLAGQVEALTATLIASNRRDKAHAGLTITDLPPTDLPSTDLPRTDLPRPDLTRTDPA